MRVSVCCKRSDDSASAVVVCWRKKSRKLSFEETKGSWWLLLLTDGCFYCQLQFCCAVSCELNLNLPSHFSNRFVCWPVKVEKRSGREGHGWLNVKGFSHHAPSGTENSVRCPRECQFDERKYGTKVVSLPGLATGTLRLSQLIGPITLAPWITKTVTVTV